MMTLPTRTTEQQRGVLYAVGAFICWGLFPLYWKPLHGIDALQILCHRIVWSALFVLMLLVAKRHFGWMRPLLRKPRTLGVFALSSLMLSFNWLIYIWAVNAGHVVEASLGYFINPLFNVLLGRLFLAERLSLQQRIAVGIAALGVVWLSWSAGAPPWIALALAATFGLYGLLRKRAPLASLEGLAIETFLMAPLALLALIVFEVQGRGAFGHVPLLQNQLLVGAGIVTAIPLLLFAAGARRLKLATVGIIQYIGPSLQLALGVLLYGEPFGPAQALGFGLIWTALLIYSSAGFLRNRRPAT